MTIEFDSKRSRIIFISWDLTVNSPFSKTEKIASADSHFLPGEILCQIPDIYIIAGIWQEISPLCERTPCCGKTSCQMPDNYIIAGIWHKIPPLATNSSMQCYQMWFWQYCHTSGEILCQMPEVWQENSHFEKKPDIVLLWVGYKGGGIPCQIPSSDINKSLCKLWKAFEHIGLPKTEIFGRLREIFWTNIPILSVLDGFMLGMFLKAFQRSHRALLP